MILAQEGRSNCVLNRILRGERNQRLHVRFLIPGARHHHVIHKLFTGQADSAEHPPDRRMKPEHHAHQIFRHVGQPVMALHVEQLVANDGTPLLSVEFEPALWKQNGRAVKTKRNRRRDISGNKKCSARDRHVIQFPVIQGERPGPHPIEPESIEARQHPHEARGHAGHDHRENDARSRPWRCRQMCGPYRSKCNVEAGCARCV